MGKENKRSMILLTYKAICIIIEATMMLVSIIALILVLLILVLVLVLMMLGLGSREDEFSGNFGV